MSTAPLSSLERRLGYRFKDQELLRQALTHRSGGKNHNERLEFVGDAVLGFVIANDLFRHHPNLSESELTLMRSAMVRAAALADVARELQLAEHLELGGNERRGGVAHRESVLADALEAVIAALYIDGGMRAAQSMIRRCWRTRLQRAADHAVKDAKTRLQEFVQGKGWPLPAYRTVSREGSEPNWRYSVECTIRLGKGSDAECEAAQGSANDVRVAEQTAAGAMLERIRMRRKKVES